MSRPTVTTVKAMVFANALDAVCIGDGKVALHFATSSGVTVVHCPLKSFVEVGRASRDHHGHYFPTLSSQRAKDEYEHQLEVDAAATAPKGAERMVGVTPDPRVRIGKKLVYGEVARVCPVAWLELETGVYESVTAAAEAHGMHASSLQVWIGKNKRAEYDAMMAAKKAARVTLYQAAKADMDADIGMSVAMAARAHGVTEPTLQRWLLIDHRPWLAKRTAKRRTLRRVANGQRVSDAARAEAGLPIPKPSN